MDCSGHADLPREKLQARGVGLLSDQELLALILNTGTRNGSCLALAGDLLERFGTIWEIAKAEAVELTRIKGVGWTKAAAISAAFELARRMNSSPVDKAKRFLCSADVFEAFHARLRDLSREVFIAVALDSRNRCRQELEIAAGGGSSCTVDTREVFRKLLLHKASAVIFVHNHPSGDPTPSRDDKVLTERLVKCGRLLGVNVLDHVIIGSGRYSSFADRGELSPRRSSRYK